MLRLKAVLPVVSNIRVTLRLALTESGWLDAPRVHLLASHGVLSTGFRGKGSDRCDSRVCQVMNFFLCRDGFHNYLPKCLSEEFLNHMNQL
jgi:hypothetical protein